MAAHGGRGASHSTNGSFDHRVTQYARRGDADRELVFDSAHGALKKATLKPPRTFKEVKIADEMAQKACGLDQFDDRSQAVLIHINEMDAAEPVPMNLKAFRKFFAV